MPGLTTHTGPARFLGGRRLKLRFRRLMPLLVWLGVLTVTVALYLRQEVGFTATGFAEETRYSVAAESAGRLLQLEVTLNQDVFQGQIVAAYETEGLLLQLQEARAELERMAHELGRERARWELDVAGQQVDLQTNLRRFAQAATDAHIDYLAARAELAEDRIELQGLELTLGRTRRLEEEELTAVAALEQDHVAFEALSESVARQDFTVTTMFTAYQDAEARYRNFRATYAMDIPDWELLLKPFESGIKVQEIRIEMVNLAVSKLVLRAPANGRVDEIFHHAGEVVAAGQPVLSVLDPSPANLVAYVPEDRILELEPGAEVGITRIAEPRRKFVSTIAYLGSSVSQLPLRIDPAGLAPSWGRAVFIPLPASLTVVPGEAFEVSF